MWTKERFLAEMTDSARLCVLLLSRDTDGTWVVRTIAENGVLVPCRKAQDEKTAVRRMAEIHRKTADKSRRITLAHANDPATAALLAGLVSKDTSFEPLDPALGSLALLYSGSLRSSPLV